MNNRTNLLLAAFVIILGLLIAIAAQNKPVDPADNDSDWQGENWEGEEKPIEIEEENLEVKEYADALKLAKQKKQHLFVYFKSNDCSACKDMEKKTFTNDKVKEALEKYVVYHVDVYEEPKVAKQYGISRVPAYFLVDAQKSTVEEPTVLKAGRASRGPKEFLLWLRVPRSLKIGNPD
jgi:thiol:disulfide interchange protein DsbD